MVGVVTNQRVFFQDLSSALFNGKIPYVGVARGFFKEAWKRIAEVERYLDEDECEHGDGEALAHGVARCLWRTRHTSLLCIFNRVYLFLHDCSREVSIGRGVLVKVVIASHVC